MSNWIQEAERDGFADALSFQLTIHLHWVRNVKPFRYFLTSSAPAFSPVGGVDKGRIVAYCNIDQEQIDLTNDASDNRNHQWSCLSSTRRASHGGEVTWPSTSTLRWELSRASFAERKARHPKIKVSLFLLVNSSNKTESVTDEAMQVNNRDQQSDAQTSATSTDFWARRTMEHVGWIALDLRDIPIIVVNENEAGIGLWEHNSVKRSVLKVSGTALGAEMSVTSYLQCDGQQTGKPERGLSKFDKQNEPIVECIGRCCSLTLGTENLMSSMHSGQKVKVHLQSRESQGQQRHLGDIAAHRGIRFDDENEMPGTRIDATTNCQQLYCSSQSLPLKENIPLSSVEHANFALKHNHLSRRKPLGDPIVREQEKIEEKADASAEIPCTHLPESMSEWHEMLKAKETEVAAIFHEREKQKDRERDAILKSAVTEIHQIEGTLNNAVADVERQKQELRMKEKKLHDQFTKYVEDLERRAQSVQRDATEIVDAATRKAKTAERKSEILQGKMDKLAKEISDIMQQKQVCDRGDSAFEALLDAQKKNMEQQRLEQNKIIEALQTKASTCTVENKDLAQKVSRLERLLNIEQEKVYLLERRNAEMSKLEESVTHGVSGLCDQELNELEIIREEFNSIEQNSSSFKSQLPIQEQDDPT